MSGLIGPPGIGRWKKSINGPSRPRLLQDHRFVGQHYGRGLCTETLALIAIGVKNSSICMKKLSGSGPRTERCSKQLWRFCVVGERTADGTHVSHSPNSRDTLKRGQKARLDDLDV
jgi:hypothetical protein